LALLHASAVHVLASSQLVAPPTQVLLLVQVSLVVQGLESSQAAPVRDVNTHAPVAESQPSLLHVLLSLQMTASPLHTPDLQTSEAVHFLPSLQAAVLLVKVHAPLPALHASLVHTLPSLHTFAVPEQLLSALQASFSVHFSPSSQDLLTLTAETHLPSASLQ